MLELYIVASVSAILTALLVVFGVQLSRSLRRFEMNRKYIRAHDEPTVSVCIPARNETHAMTQCLERVLASDYRKLEVIVFDDSSDDDTSILVRSFAHVGVRFVPGTALPDGWLGKNHALDILAGEASGELLLFLDVDTIIDSTTISQLVGYARSERLSMLSVIPMRRDMWRASVLFGHLRYFWQLILNRPGAPAISSALWMISSDALAKFGGFGTVKNNVQPEFWIAKSLSAPAYRCLLADLALGVSYEKKWRSQLETGRRLLYPMVGGRPIGAVAGLAVLVLLNLPPFVLLSGFVFGWDITQIMALWLMLCFMALYGVYTGRVWHRGWWFGGILWPLVILQELIVFITSVWGYARHTITWKGRPLGAPMIQVDHLVIDE